MKNLNEQTYNNILQEASDYFKSQGISIIGEGFKEIATNPALLESYIDQLTTGADADNTANMAQLMVNSNASILRESSMTGIQPVASLSMPVIRKLWPKFALKEAIATEVAKSPRFVVSYTKPYLFRAASDGTVEKRYIPDALRGYAGSTTVDGTIDSAIQKDYSAEHVIDLSVGGAAVIDFTKLTGVGTGAADPAVVISGTSSLIKVQPLDELVIEKVQVGTVTSEVDTTFKALATPRFIKIGKRLGVLGSAVYDAGTDGQLIVQFDGAADKATFAWVGATTADIATGGLVQITVKAGVSTENNEHTWDVGFDLKREDIDIPTGQHINAPLPIESLNDMMALYQIDGTKETVDLMTNVFSQKLDLEVLDFLRDSFANQPGNEAFEGYPSASDYCFTFDCRPAAGFAGSPKAWREEIKPLIDFLAQKIKNQTYLQSGIFTIVGNPLDIQILANVDWQFRGGQGGNMDGVDVDYSIGTYVGANAYKVIASTNVPQGAMYLVFRPTSTTQMTYKYYPYTFSTEMGYIDSNNSKVPNIMMTKREQFHEFMPAIGAILVEHNDGKNYFAKSVVTTSESVAGGSWTV